MKKNGFQKFDNKLPLKIRFWHHFLLNFVNVSHYFEGKNILNLKFVRFLQKGFVQSNLLWSKFVSVFV